jgi:hypothetical protein
MIVKKQKTVSTKSSASNKSRPNPKGKLQDLILKAEMQYLAEKANTDYELEYRFAAPRQFRFDASFPKLKIGIEIDGGVFISGRHTRGTGFVRDMEKLNLAALLGYRIFRFTPRQLCAGEMREFLTKVLEGKTHG